MYPSQREAFESEVEKIKKMIKSGDSKTAAVEINRLKNFRLPKLEYKEVPVDDTGESWKSKYKKSVNDYGYTGSKDSEKYLNERFEYYLKEVVIPTLK